ncbi:MAG: endonuclease domain-containing protein [Acidobacteria bacterium]|nr:endonuclease domain-containing protein [Acidobacteriota bacterium]MCI0721370.1 endonuclease domain-containing protein [Acidobacteriota bacterium]
MPTKVPGRDKANSPSLTPRARELRHSDTLAEKLAWMLLRNRQLLRYKFRRQLPLDNAIVDFCCLSLKLVVELDGAGHAYGFQAKRDRQRDRELEERGYRVLRVPNGMVLKAPTEFVKKIRERIAQLEQARLDELRRLKLI